MVFMLSKFGESMLSGVTKRCFFAAILFKSNEIGRLFVFTVLLLLLGAAAFGVWKVKFISFGSALGKMLTDGTLLLFVTAVLVVVVALIVVFIVKSVCCV